MKCLILCLLLLATSCMSIPKVFQSQFNNPPLLKSGFTSELGGFSGLSLVSNNVSQKTFVTLTDRGPNAEAIKKSETVLRPFTLPSYSPEIVKFSISDGKISIDERIPLRWKSKMASGLPNSKLADETPVDAQLQTVSFDAYGVDPEGIVMDKKGYYWIVEEYGPSLLQVRQDGLILQRFIPFGSSHLRGGKEALPGFLSNRRKNRGFEGVALSGNKLYLALQSPIKKGDNFWEKNHAIPIIEFDINSFKTTGVFAYKFASVKAKKVGGLTSEANGDLLLIEQNSITKSGAYKALTRLSVEKATNLCPYVCGLKLKKHTLLSQLKIQTIHIKKHLNLEKLIKNVPEKLEGVALFGQGQIALISDNDFNVNVSTVGDRKSALASQFIIVNDSNL